MTRELESLDEDDKNNNTKNKSLLDKKVYYSCHYTGSNYSRIYSFSVSGLM
jgi:hypothetical protein